MGDVDDGEIGLLWLMCFDDCYWKLRTSTVYVGIVTKKTQKVSDFCFVGNVVQKFATKSK